MTVEEIQSTVKAARDSVWVIEDSISRLYEDPESEKLKASIERNVSHLKLVVASPDIANSSEDISDLNSAILAGEAALV